MMTQTKAKLKEQFYPLTETHAQKMRKSNLTAAEWRIWSYLVSIDPWGDKYHDIKTLTVMSECNCSKATFYRAISKFQELGLFDFQDKGFSFKNEVGTEKLRKGYLKNETEILKNETEILKNETEILKNETEKPPEPLSNKDFESSQTSQTFPNLQTEEEEKNSIGLDEEKIKETFKTLTGITMVIEDNIDKNQSINKDEIPPVRSMTEVKQSTPNKPDKPNNLTPELIAKLEKLSIPLDSAIKKVITTHHSSQIWRAIRHIEDTYENIQSPYAVFLYQVPRQGITNLPKDPLTSEFLEWYAEAIATGQVKNRSAQHLPLDQFHEPLVELSDGRQFGWEKVKRGEIPTQASDEQITNFFKSIKETVNYLRTKSNITQQ